VSGRFFIVGQTQKGTTTPTVIRSMREYIATFGARTGGVSMYDAAELALRAGVAELVVCRATGSAAATASLSMDTGKIVVTARSVGAYANSFTAAYTSATNTLTIVTDVGTETYVGATAAALLAEASISTTVAVTSSGTLPASNVTVASLTGGADDYAGVAWATVLAAIPADLGPGAIATGMVLMSRAQGPVQSSLVVAAIALTLAVAYAAMRSGELLARVLGTTGRLVTERLIGLLLAAVATQFIVDGARGAWRA
jgi:hypothetical protein